MKELIIYHHLGLGDHIICNGLVREIIKKNQFEFYKLIVKKHNLPSVKFMYEDVKNLSFFIVNDDSQADQIIINNNIPCIKVGFKSPPENITWDQLFYIEAGIDFNKRWESFYIKRNKESEEDLFNKLNPNKEDYVLIHNKGSDGIDRIKYKLIDDKIKKIFVEKHTNIMFDYRKLIENAKEIHCISSSFKDFVDSLDIDIKVYYHNIPARPDSNHKIKLNWILV
jgi:hypothetical protein